MPVSSSRSSGGTSIAIGGGCCGERMGLRHGVFHATHLRNAQALDASRPAECCLSLELCNCRSPCLLDSRKYFDHDFALRGPGAGAGVWLAGYLAQTTPQPAQSVRQCVVASARNGGHVRSARNRRCRLSQRGAIGSVSRALMVGRCVRERRLIRSTEADTATSQGSAARRDPEGKPCGPTFGSWSSGSMLRLASLGLPQS
jgi:hypothetical protein